MIASLNGSMLLQIATVLGLLGGAWWIGRVIRKRMGERDAAAQRESDKSRGE